MYHLRDDLASYSWSRWKAKKNCAALVRRSLRRTINTQNLWAIRIPCVNLPLLKFSNQAYRSITSLIITTMFCYYKL